MGAIAEYEKELLALAERDLARRKKNPNDSSDGSFVNVAMLEQEVAMRRERIARYEKEGL